MKKKAIALILSIAMVLGTVAAATGSSKSITVSPMTMTINGAVVTPTKSDGTAAEVFSYDGATYVPLRYLSELMGVQVEWDASDPATAKLLNVPNFVAPAGPTGTYEGTANGNNGPIKVAVTIESGRITKVEILSHSETAGLADPALARLPGAIVDKQSINLDTVTGATNTSKGILNAVKQSIEAAGLSVEDFSKKDAGNAVLETKAYETDVVIVGGGLSGVTAAISAAEAGARVVVLEKTAVCGGNSLKANSGYMIAEFPENKDYHITDEADTLDAAIERWKGFQAASIRESLYPDYDRLSYMLVQSMSALHWMQEHGISFVPKRPIGDKGMAVVTGDAPDMTADRPAGRVIEKLEGEAKELGVIFLMETRANELITDNGAVVGVRAQATDHNVEVKAKKCILACGSYPDNPEMIAKLVPEIPESTSTTTYNTGDGIEMALKVGAVLYEDQWITGSPSPALINENPMAAVFVEGGSPLDVSASTYERLMVNQNGERFMDEASHYTYQVMVFAYDNKGPYWSLYDQLDPRVAEIADTGLGKTVYKADTLEDLAKQAGIDPATFQATFAKYNAAATAGKDEEFGKAAKYLKPYGEGPYYLVQVIPSITDIMGGIKTSYDFEVLNASGNPIDNLYAIGSMTNRSYFNQWYVSGSFLTFAATAGQLTGAKATRDMGK